MMTPQLERETKLHHGRYDDYDEFVFKILAPEIVAVIISEDYDCSLELGYHIGWLSAPFGEREFPAPLECPVLGKLHKVSSRANLLQMVADEGWNLEDVGLDSTGKEPKVGRDRRKNVRFSE